MKKLVFGLMLFAMAWPGVGTAEPVVDIRELMSAEEYRAAGLDGLTEEQRQALSAWLRSFQEARAAAAVSSEAPEAEAGDQWGFSKPKQQKDQSKKQIVARIDGPFRGWSGKTVFRLDNGQVWEQRRSGRFTYTGDARDVVISKSRWGFFEMTLVEVDRTVGVRRIQ